MGNIQFRDGKILFRDGKIAFNGDCCCEPPPVCPCVEEEFLVFEVAIDGVEPCCMYLPSFHPGFTDRYRLQSSQVNTTFCVDLAIIEEFCPGANITNGCFCHRTFQPLWDAWAGAPVDGGDSGTECTGSPTQEIGPGGSGFAIYIWYSAGWWYVNIRATLGNTISGAGIGGNFFVGRIWAPNCPDELIIANQIEDCEDDANYCGDFDSTPQTAGFGGTVTLTRKPTPGCA
jgi:hypothetical protein